MRKNLLPWTAAFGIVASLAFSSCAYDPYYTSVGGSYSSYGSYSSAYGHGHGYGGSGFNTSIFVSTGDSRWGYDPYSYSYYDYRTRRYYDPYLYGYYPIGYRPPIVYGVPHPYGWRPGSGYCPPPRTVRNVTVVNYRDRESAYRKSNYKWSNQVRQKSYSDHRTDGRRDESRTGSRPATRGGSPSYNPRTSSGSSRQTRNSGDGNRSVTESRQSSRNDPGNQNTGRYSRGGGTRTGNSEAQGRLPSGYNTPVTRPPSIQSDSALRDPRSGQPRIGSRQSPTRQPAVQPASPQRFSGNENRARQSQEPSVRSRGTPPQPGIQRQERQERQERQPQPQPQPQADPGRNSERDENRRGLRSLGDG